MQTCIKLRIERPSHIPMDPPRAAMNVGIDHTHFCSSVKYSNDPQLRFTNVRSATAWIVMKLIG